MIDNENKARELKEKAKDQKDIADMPSEDTGPMEIMQRLQKAQHYLAQAIELLLPIYKIAEGDKKIQLSRELADCYGIMGGVFRRQAVQGNSKDYLLKSAEMYNEGLKYEINDSYNLFNSIVIQIMLDPITIEKQYPRIEECNAKIQEQVKGSRIDQWWAWADLGLCNLLLERREEAQVAYEHFTRSGSRAQDYDSVYFVLKNLEASLQKAQSLRPQSVAQSIQKIITFLEGYNGPRKLDHHIDPL